MEIILIGLGLFILFVIVTNEKQLLDRVEGPLGLIGIVLTLPFLIIVWGLVVVFSPLYLAAKAGEYIKAIDLWVYNKVNHR